MPFTVPIGESTYPSLEKMLSQLGKASDRIIQLDAAKLAQEAGSRLATNSVMLGALFGTEQFPIKIATIKETIEVHLPVKVVPVNIKAFNLGYETCQQAVK